MVLGVVLHSAAGFSSDSGWLINYSPSAELRSSVFLNTINAGIHSFRMPLFFMVAGYFSMLVINKVGSKVFIQQRLLRVALPLLVCMLTFNTFQSWILSVYEKESFLELYSQQAISHLWFLINLLIYSLVLLVCTALCNKFNFSGIRIANKTLLLGLLIAFPLFVFPILALGQMGIPIYRQIPIVGMPYYLYFYFGFFSLGVFLHQQQAWLGLIRRLMPLWLFLFVISLFAENFVGIWTEGQLAKLLKNYIEALNTLTLCLSLWGVSMYLLEKRSVWLTKLADASYSIYLIHHCLVVLFVLIANIYLAKMNPIALSIFCVIVVFLVSYGFHCMLVKKSMLMKKLFNGK